MSGLERLRLPSSDPKRRADPLLAAVTAAWPEAAGPAIARESMPVRTSGGAVVVHCSSSTWAAELALLERPLGARLAAALGSEEPPRLRFRVGELPAPAPAAPEPAGAPPPAAPGPPRPEAQAVAAGIAADALRETVERALSAAIRDGRGPVS